MPAGGNSQDTLITPAHDSATAVIQVGRWLLPIACVLAFSTLLTFAVEQPFVRDQPSVTPGETTIPAGKASTTIDFPSADDNHWITDVYVDPADLQTPERCVSRARAPGDRFLANADEMARALADVCQTSRSAPY
jgi:hypothetical protein